MVDSQQQSRICHVHVLTSNEATTMVLDLFGLFVEHKLLRPAGLGSPTDTAALGCVDEPAFWSEELSNIERSSLTTCQFQNNFALSFHPAERLIEHPALQTVVDVTGCDSLTCQTWLSRLFIAYYLPLSVSRMLLIDLDVLILGNLAELFGYFHSMPDEALIGIGYEFQPLDTAWMQPSVTRFNLGYGPHIGFPTLNGGISLYDLKKMRQSKTYRQLVFNTTHLWRMRKEFTNTTVEMPWGDQDLLTLIYFEQPALFYIIPCGWNYQLCSGGFYRAHAAHRPFEFWCQDLPQIYHTNCQSSFPSEANGIMIVISESRGLIFEDAPARKSIP
eukprot:TRINITY_DN1625_c0_g1_i1.p1 TRINITY_DN1625_c0_g1~~TRINITY_DN1625_c0_g1_i1.p1  ORF type:complete len:331 (+),score=-23.85 TRINITY_DN1625_c0_g1_i1:734-1726(+)